MDVVCAEWGWREQVDLAFRSGQVKREGKSLEAAGMMVSTSHWRSILQ